jgi:hypothetical protein
MPRASCRLKSIRSAGNTMRTSSRRACPGAGNLLLFDNQGEAGYPAVTLKVLSGSRVLEIDPAKQRIV